MSEWGEEDSEERGEEMDGGSEEGRKALEKGTVGTN